MIRRLIPLRLLLAAVLVVDVAAVGAHEIAVRSAPCYWAVWRVPQCRVMSWSLRDGRDVDELLAPATGPQTTHSDD